jgi:hypothetical protein
VQSIPIISNWAPRTIAACFFLGAFVAPVFFLLRFFPALQNEEFTSHLETLESILTDYGIEDFFMYKRELMEEIRAHPNFDPWSRSLPDDVRSVVYSMLKENHDLELMKKADILPEEDLITYPFLVTLLRRNPEVLEYKITRVFEEMKDSIKLCGTQA